MQQANHTQKNRILALFIIIIIQNYKNHFNRPHSSWSIRNYYHHITVIVAAILLGPADGGIIGGIWGPGIASCNYCYF